MWFSVVGMKLMAVLLYVCPHHSRRLEELQEKIILEVAGDKVTPMVANPGRILLTSHRLYFQPFNNAEVVSAHILYCAVCVCVCVCCVCVCAVGVV